MNFSEVKELHERFLTPNYSRVSVAVARTEGSLLYDVEGRRYIDLFPGWGVGSVGYCHPSVARAVARQARQFIHVPNNFHVPEQAQLAAALVERAFAGRVFFCNSGAEAIEAAIKLARLYGRARRYKIVSCDNSFHGRTFGALSATGQEKYQRDFRPLVPGFRHVPFNDLAAVSSAIDEETVAVIIEPVQGEGGVNVADADYLTGLRRLTREKDVLLILDEVQTGFGRTGKWFAYQHYGIQPDILCLSKALGGGVPIGAMLAAESIAGLLAPGTHASTFGGNALACAAGLAVMKVLAKQRLVERAGRDGARLGERFHGWRQRMSGIKDVRGLGFMWGIELEGDGAPVVNACLERGVNVNCTHRTVLRIMPALNIPDELLDEGLSVLEGVLREGQAGAAPAPGGAAGR